MGLTNFTSKTIDGSNRKKIDNHEISDVYMV